MKIKSIIWFIAALFVSTGCYEDKGNYDYSDVNLLEIKFPQESYSTIVTTPVEVVPQFIYTNDSSAYDLSYEWLFLNKVISTERILHYAPDTIITQTNLYLRVTDKNTGIVYPAEIPFGIKPVYGDRGWMILSEKDNKSCFSFIREYTQYNPATDVTTFSYTEEPDVFRKMNEIDLGSKPIGILEHFCANSSTKIAPVWIIQGGSEGCMDLSGETFEKELSLKDIFLDGQLPAGFDPASIWEMKWFTLAISKDGKIYSRKKITPNLYHSGYFLDMPMTFEGKNINGLHIYPGPFKNMLFSILFDQDNQRFLILYDNNNYASGQINHINVNENANPTGAAKLDNIGDMKWLFGGTLQVGSAKQTYASILQSPGGKFYLHEFDMSSFLLGSPSATSIRQSEVPSLDNIIDGASSNVFNAMFDRFSAYLLISKDNELYICSNRGGTPPKFDLYHSFGAKITAINSDSNFPECVGIGLENGEFYVMDFTWKAIQNQKPKVIFHSTNNYGKIVGVRYKAQSGYNWSL